MCLNWFFSLWATDPQAYAAADALAEAEAAEEVSPGFRWTEEASRAVHPTVWTPQSSATTPASPATGGRQARPAPPATPAVEARATPGRSDSEVVYEAAGVISMLMPGNELVDELRELGARRRDIEDHIEEFGTTPPVGDGITDDTTALQAVLDRYYK